MVRVKDVTAHKKRIKDIFLKTFTKIKNITDGDIGIRNGCLQELA